MRLASIGRLASAIGAISWILVQNETLTYILVVVGLRLLQSAAGRMLNTTAALQGTASIFDSFYFFLDGEREIRKKFTLARRRTSQIVNRRRRNVGVLGVEVWITMHFKCRTNCFLNHCWFSLSLFSLNDRLGQPVDECCEEELIAHGIVDISLSCKLMECPVRSDFIMAGLLSTGFEIGLQNGFFCRQK